MLCVAILARWQIQTEQLYKIVNRRQMRKTACSEGFGGAVTQKSEYDFEGTFALLRETVHNYQTFATNPLYKTFSYPTFSATSTLRTSPCQTIVYDGNSNRYAETDYFYDNGGSGSVCPSTAGTPSVTTVSNLVVGTHDETNYGSSSTTPRGNLTKVVEQCFQGTQACSSGNPTTTYTYDETGQVTSSTDPKTNTTQYSYADRYTNGTPPGNTNAYLTTLTRPTVNGVTTHGYYQYDYVSGQLSVSQDDNDLANGTKTAYSYVDPLFRSDGVASQLQAFVVPAPSQKTRRNGAPTVLLMPTRSKSGPPAINRELYRERPYHLISAKRKAPCLIQQRTSRLKS
jgi:YD repeat-containing protein